MTDPFERLKPVGDEPLFLPVADLAGKPVPAREWHVPDLIPAHQVTMLSGDGGVGKSLLALQLAVATAAGTSWIGRPVDRPGPALYLSAEDEDAELHRRLVDICRAEELDLARLDLHRRALAGSEALLATFDRQTQMIRATPLWARLTASVAEVEPRLLILDTLADLHAGDEINRTHARQFVGLLRGLAISHRIAVVLLAHPSLSGMASGSGLSGSTAWNASVRSRLYLERVSDEGHEAHPNLRRLTNKKSNYGKLGIEIALTWREGVFVANPDETGLDRLAKSAKAERVFLKLLAEFNAEGRRVRHTTGHGYAPAEFAKSGRAEGCSKDALRLAMNTLFADGRIRAIETGPNSRRYTHLVEVAE